MTPRRTPISYYGGKQRMLSDILPMIPQHKIYCEPYFGGGAVFFAKPPAELEAINDTNGNVVNFYQVMKSDFRALEFEIQKSLYSERLHKEAAFIYHNPDEYTQVKRAWAFWFLLNFSFLNKVGAGWKCDNSTGGSHAGVTFKRKKFEFSAYANRLEKVQISERNGIKVIKKRDSIDTFHFIDFPYVDTDQGHYKGFYQEDLEELLHLLPSLQGKIMLCHYPNKDISDLWHKQGWYVKSLNMRLSADITRANRRKQEVIFTNYQPLPSLFDNEKTSLASCHNN